MQPHRTIGEALVDVYDSIVTLIRTELRLLTRRVGKILKAKGMGLALLLAAVGPLLFAVIFLILALFYGLIDAGLEAWASALIVAALALIIAGVLAAIGVKELTKEVKADESPKEAARENVEAARKNLEKQEQNLDKQEKKVDKAEKKLDSAEQDLQKQQGAPVAHSTPRDASGRTVVAHPETFDGEREPKFTKDLATPDAVKRDKADDGITVTTKPELDEEDKK